MTNWTQLVAKLTKAERDVAEWKEGLRDAEKTLAGARSEMTDALGKPVEASNGSAHKAAPAPLVKVRRNVRRDYGRRDRVAALIKSRGFVTVGDVAAAEKCGRGLLHSVLFDLVKRGKIARVSQGRYASLSVGKAA